MKSVKSLSGALLPIPLPARQHRQHLGIFILIHWSDELGADAAIFGPTDHRLDLAANRQSDNQPFAFADHRLRSPHQAKARNIDEVTIARSGLTGKGRSEERSVGKECGRRWRNR